MVDPKRILVLTADVGFGHRKAADAIAAALRDVHRERVLVEIENPLDDERTPAVLHDSQSDYDRLVREMPDYYRLRYQFSEAALPSTIMESAVTVMLFRVIQDIVERFKPDVIIATHPMYPAPLNAVNAVLEKNIPFFTVVTDLAMVHRLWFNPAAEFCLVPTEKARQDAIELDFPENKLKVTGIPVHPDLVREQREPAAIRAELGWRPDLTTALVVGSKRVRNLEAVLHVLNHAGLPLQKVIVTGGDDELYARFQQTEWHGVTHLYNLVENMAAMMHASDLVISKAGGLVVTESLACGLPMLLVDVTPGQEEGNANYVVSNGAAELAESPVEALEILFHWMDHDCRSLKERARNALHLGRPQSAYEIADLAWMVAERGPLSIPDNRTSLIPKLMELLNQFGIVGKEPPVGDETQPV